MSDNITPKDRLTKNTVYSVIGNVWTMLIAFFIQPYIFHHIGSKKYGILVIFTLFVNWSRIADFGLSNTLVKFFGDAHAVKDTSRFNKIMTTSFYFYLLLGYVFLLPSELYSKFLTTIFMKSPTNEIILFFKVTILNIVLTNIITLLVYCVYSLHRLDIVNKLSIPLSVPSVLGTIFVLDKGYGLVGLAMLGTSLNLLAIVVYVFCLKYLGVNISLSPKNVDKKLYLETLSFGYPLEICNVFDLIFFQTDRYILGRIFNQIETVSFYQFGCSVMYQIRNTILLIISAILPTAVDLAARKEEKSLLNLFIRGSKYLTIASFPCLLFIMLFADEILTFWIGQGLWIQDTQHIAAGVLRIVTIGYIFNLISGAATSIGLAISKPGLQLKTASIGVFLTVITFLLLKNSVQTAYNLALSITIGLTICTISYLVLIHEHIKFQAKIFIKDVFLNPLILAVVSIVPACVVKFVEIKYGFGNNRWNCLVILLVGFGFSFLTFIVAALKFKVLDDYDKNTIMDLLRRYIFKKV